MRGKELFLQAELAGAEAKIALNPHVRNGFLQIQRWYERLAAMEVAAEEQRGRRRSDRAALQVAAANSHS